MDIKNAEKKIQNGLSQMRKVSWDVSWKFKGRWESPRDQEDSAVLALHKGLKAWQQF